MKKTNDKLISRISIRSQKDLKRSLDLGIDRPVPAEGSHIKLVSINVFQISLSASPFNFFQSNFTKDVHYTPMVFVIVKLSRGIIENICEYF